APSGGDREIFPKDELIKEFSLERVTPSPAIFDNEKLNWLNRHYIKQSPPERIHQLSYGFLQRAGLLPERMNGAVQAWADRVIDLLVPYVDRLEQLPERAGILFRHNPVAALAVQENAEALKAGKAVEVVREFAKRSESDSPLTPERFKAIMNDIKAALGVKGKDLFHPVRIALIGSHSGPDFDRLIPLIEEGSQLALPVHVKSVRERMRDFLAAVEHR
ncbi:MAG TPA: glutamate--tRNA ligase, partial [Candidatus Angelobacter sp.]|nr:glutamate--tRNA ligase [Candidatus Angelobacter sp.]